MSRSASTDLSARADDHRAAPVAEGTWRSKLGPRLLIAAVVVWLWSLIEVDLLSMTDVGLMSVLPSPFFLALALLTIGFLFVLEHRSHDRLLVGGYLVTFAAVAHATPAILYGTVRYSWSFKHLGMVDYIQRNGEVDPDAVVLQIHHGWPGVFSTTSMVSEITGVEAQTIAIWSPFAFSLVSLLALSIVFRAFVNDERVASLSLWLFVVANWVGQEYFSPQGFTFAIYLALLAVVIPFLRVDEPDPTRFQLHDGADLTTADTRQRLVVACLIVMMLLSISASHQLTPIMVVVSFAILSAFRICRSAWVAVAGLALTIAWASGPALTYLSDNGLDVADALGSPAETSGASVVDIAQVSVGHAIVVVADRFLAEAMIVLAILGLVVVWRRREGGPLIAALLAAPIVLLVTGFRGEVLFRSYLFAVPWIALCSAIALVIVTKDRSFPVQLATRSAVITILLVAFLFAYLGNERTNYFTADEVELVEWVNTNAPPNTLLIEGSQNYPGRARNYERFSFVPISLEPDASLVQMNDDPEGLLYRWMTDERYAASYLILTRSMKNEQESVPSMPAGLLDRIDLALRESDRFRILRSNLDGTVWVAIPEES